LPLPIVSDWFRGLTSNSLIDVARRALGMNPLALGLAMALIGASFGALVGSLQAS
jgi:hypothetical protein